MKLLDTQVFVELALGQQPGLTGPFAVSAMTAAELGCFVRAGGASSRSTGGRLV